jgi:hypothetical protein
MPARYPLHVFLWAIPLLCACSSESRLGGTIDGSPQGAVYLKQTSDSSFQAAHPIKIDASIIAMVLNGILVRNNEPGASETAPARRAFAGSEVRSLAPRISENLRRAESNQQVEFSAGQLVGVLYAMVARSMSPCPGMVLVRSWPRPNLRMGRHRPSWGCPSFRKPPNARTAILIHGRRRALW